MVMENAVATELVYTGVVDGVFTLTVLGDKFRPTKSTNTNGHCAVRVWNAEVPGVICLFISY